MFFGRVVAGLAFVLALSGAAMLAGALEAREQASRDVPWEDPQVNEMQRLPMRTSFFAFEDAQLAKIGDRARSNRFLSLNGLATNAQLKPGQKVKLVVYGTRRG